MAEAILEKLSLRKDIQPLPYQIYWSAAFILALLALVDSVYLAVSHYRIYTDIGYKSFCAISKAINCDTVSQSPYAILAGMPVSVWGILGYAWFLLLLLPSIKVGNGSKHIWSFLFMMSLIYSLYSIFLAFVSSYYIRSFCLMCIISYGINLWLFFLTWIVRRRFRTGSFVVSFRQCLEYLASNQRWVLGAMLPFLLTVALTLTFFPQYWNLEGTVVMTDIPNGVSEEGDPWIGAANPSLEIIEFADYQCFQCRKMHFYLRQLIIQHPGKIRLIHRNYPMDDKVNPVVKEPFHIGSGALAMLAIYASSKGKFWEMNDVLYELAGKTERINVASVASLVGLDAHEIGAGIRSPNVLAKLRKDIQTGLQLGIVGTPAYLVDGKLSFGMIPSEYLSIVFE